MAEKKSIKSLRAKLLKLRRSSAKKKTDEQVGYLAGAWRELKQVRWTDRRATWSLTFAVVLFSVFFAVLILGLDFVFNELFRKVLL